MKLSRSLSALSLLGGALMLSLSSFSPSMADVVSEPGGELEPVLVGKCCNPAKPKPPSAGCPAGPCRAMPLCPAGSFEGSWDEGGCQAKKNKECDEDPDGDPFKPKYKCRPTLQCTLEGGGTGYQCQFESAGETGNQQTDVKDCSGDACP